MIPYKYSKADVKTGKTYEHIFTTQEQDEMKTRIKSGENIEQVLRDIRKRLTDDDWVEV